MMETLEAADLEKQKHNNTRMEVLTRLAGLEAENAELTRSLAAGQKKLETQIDQVAVLKQQVELKESTLEELKRNTFNIGGRGTTLKQVTWVFFSFCFFFFNLNVEIFVYLV
jgi:chromosome segregation ATPase